MRRALVSLLVAVILPACATSGQGGSEPVETVAQRPAREPTPARPEPGTYPPPWLGTRLLELQPSGFGQVGPTPRALRHRRFTLPDQVPMLPGRGFRARVRSPAPDAVVARSSWEPGCPIAADGLAWLRLRFWGFDDQSHTGELLVDAAVADDLVGVFRRLHQARFPLEQVVIAGPYEPGGPTTGDGNGSGAFVCRASTGASYFSQHAYGLAIDLNPFQNPYVKDDLVLPELASAYLDRGWGRRGMVQPDDVVVRAFASIGWEWGGAWRYSKDYQHFSQNGR